MEGAILIKISIEITLYKFKCTFHQFRTGIKKYIINFAVEFQQNKVLF